MQEILEKGHKLWGGSGYYELVSLCQLISPSTLWAQILWRKLLSLGCFGEVFISSRFSSVMEECSIIMKKAKAEAKKPCLFYPRNKGLKQSALADLWPCQIYKCCQAGTSFWWQTWLGTGYKPINTSSYIRKKWSCIQTSLSSDVPKRIAHWIKNYWWSYSDWGKTYCYNNNSPNEPTTDFFTYTTTHPSETQQDQGFNWWVQDNGYLSRSRSLEFND